MIKNDIIIKVAQIAEKSQRFGSLKSRGIAPKRNAAFGASIDFSKIDPPKQLDESKFNCSYGL